LHIIATMSYVGNVCHTLLVWMLDSPAITAPNV